MEENTANEIFFSKSILEQFFSPPAEVIFRWNLHCKSEFFLGKKLYSLLEDINDENV